MAEELAIPAPETTSPFSSVTLPTKDDAVISVNAQRYVADKGRRGNIGKRYNNVNQRNPYKYHKQNPCALRYVKSHNFGNGFGFMAHGGNQAAHIVNAADKNTAEDYPQKCRRPAVNYRCQDRPVNRTGSCNSGKMLAQQHALFGRHIVYAVFHLNRRHGIFVIKLKNSVGKKLAKISALATTINSTNCDSSHHHGVVAIL